MANRHNFFLPYMRQGLAAAQKQTLESGNRTILNIRLNVKVKGETEEQSGEREVTKEVALFGPGDVLGINPRIISRVAPPLSTKNFEANYVPFLEFKEPDFLWRFSTRKTEDGENWLPWLSLIVLKSASGEDESEFVELPNRNPNLPARIQLNANAILPDLKESWRWSHVHLLDIEGSNREQIVAEIKRNPKKAVCRLMCSRKLQPQTKYHAFLIPTYRIGADVALGLSDTNVGTALTWENPSDTSSLEQLPYYYQWEFRTGTDGDFEYLVRKLQPRPLENLGTQPMDCSSPGFGLQPEQEEMQLESSLQSLDTNYQAESMEESIRENLTVLLNQSNDLVVTPPVYGEWHAEVADEEEKLDAANQEWLEEVNLDFRHRAAAGLGVQFVKENQEGLMKAAWEQYNKVQEANRRLNLGRFGRTISTCLYKRLDKMSKKENISANEEQYQYQDRFLKLTLPLQNKVLQTEESSKTIGAKLENSRISNKLTQVKIKKYLPQKRVTPPSMNRSEKEETTFFPPITNPQIVSRAFRVQGTNNSIKDRIRSTYRTWIMTPTEEEPLFNDLGKKMRHSLIPTNTIEKPLANRMERMRGWEKHLQKKNSTENTFTTANDNTVDELRPILWHPEFHRPLNRFLRELSQDYILAGVEKIPTDTIGLLQTNRRFIEAFMLGANHEFASELRWREFPTDMRGSYFRSFWDTSIYSLDSDEQKVFRKTEIGERFFEKIKIKYGNLKDGNENLLYNTMPKIETTYLKGDSSEIEKEIADAYETAVEKWLLTRNEDKDIDQITNWSKPTQLGDHPIATYETNQADGTSRLVLVVRGELLQKYGNTLIYLIPKKGKKPDFTKDAKRIFPVFEGKLPPDLVFVGFPISEEDARENKHFLIFEERTTDLRFGLDKEKEGDQINDFSWEHFGIEEGGYLDALTPEIFAKDWNSAAFIGKTMLQKQVRVAVELKSMLPPSENDNN